MKTTFKVIVMTLAFLLIAEGMGQLAIRYFESRTPTGIEAENIMSYREPLVGFGLKKNIHERMTGWTVDTNTLGFRDAENFSVAKPKNEIRIILVGGSTIFGWGVETNATLPAKLEALIHHSFGRDEKELGRSIRVINAGVPWYSSWHEATVIFTKLIDYSPDEIIVMDGLNDTAAALAPLWRPIAEGYTDVPSQAAYQRRVSSATVAGALVSLADLSPTFRYFNARRQAKIQSAVGVPHPEVWDQYLRYFERTKVVLENRGIPLKIYFQPVMPVDKPLTPFEVDHNGTSMKQEPFAENFRTLYKEGEKEVTAASSLNVKSLRDIFKNEQGTIYLDGLHYNEAGNQRLAEAIFSDEVRPFLSQKLGGNPSVALQRE